MRPAYAIFLALILATAAYAASTDFDPTQYLYKGENASSITTSSFSLGNDSYSIISFNGVETFLTKNGALVPDAGTIQGAIKTNFLSSYFVSDAEKTELKTLVKSFNDSRNAVTPYGPAESTCTQFTGQQNHDCNDANSCYVSCSALPELCAPGFSSTAQVDYNGQSAYLGNVYANILTDFAVNRHSLDQYASSFFTQIDLVTTDNVVTKLDTLATLVSSMDATSKKMQTTLLRGGNGVYASASQCKAGAVCDVCPTCIGICPRIPFDSTSLSTALQKLNGYKARASPLAKLPTLPAQIAQKTQDRIKYKADTATSGDYLDRYDNLKAKYANNTRDAHLIQASVSNATFSAAVTGLDATDAKIQQGISNFDFSNLDTLIKQYDSQQQSVAKMLPGARIPYDQAVAAKEATAAMIVRAQWRLDPSNKQLMASYATLKATQARYDSNFKPPYTPQDFAAITKSYGLLTNKTSDLINTATFSGNTLYSFVGNIARVTTNGVLSVVGNIWPVNYKTRQVYAIYVPLVLVILSIFSFISLSVFVFVTVLVRLRHMFTNRMIFAGWIFVLLIINIIVIASLAGFYLLINQAATSSYFVDFYYEVLQSKSAVLLLDYTNSTAGGRDAMSACANQIGSHLKNELNVSYTTIRLSQDKCYMNATATTGIPSDTCFQQINDVPVFHLRQSAQNQTPVFSVVYKKEALVSGDATYLTTCDLAQALIK